MTGSLSRQIGTAFALTAFAVSVVSGLIAGAPSTIILVRSIVVLLGGAAIGRVLGYLVTVALNEHLTAMAAADPIPEPVEINGQQGGGTGQPSGEGGGGS